MIDARFVLEAYAERHNAGVRSRDFAPLLEILADDAVFEFTQPALHLDGKPAIAKAFAQRPPSDELVLSSIQGRDHEHASADYAWRTQPHERAGTIELTLSGAHIVRLVVRAA